MNFLTILEEFNNTENQDLKLIKVQFFNGDNGLKIHLFSKDMVDEVFVEKLKEKILESIDLDASILSIKVYDFESYCRYFSESLNRENKVLSLDCDNDLIINDDGVTIELTNKFKEYEIYKTKSFSDFDRLMNEASIKVNFKIVKDDFLEESVKKSEEEALESIKSKIIASSQVEKKNNKRAEVPKENSNIYSFGFKRKTEPDFVNLQDLVEDPNMVYVEGKVYEYSSFETRNGDFVVSFDLDDGKYAVKCKKFIRKKDMENFSQGFKNGLEVKIYGVYKFDDFEKDKTLDVSYIEETTLPIRQDEANEKRIEFTLHSKYSNLEGLVDVKELMERLSLWGHKSVAITDSYNVQSYPEIYKAAKSAGIKLNLGCEFKMLDDRLPIVTNLYAFKVEEFLNKDIVVFDIETTGLSRYRDNITEIGGVKIRNGEVVEIFQQLVNPEMIIPDFITDLTGITNEMVANEPTISQVMPSFLAFCEGTILAAHNADFDIGFIKRKSEDLGLDFRPIVLDTLWLARSLNPQLKNHKLNTLTKNYQVKLLNHHRASDDAKATAEILIKMLKEVEEKGYSLSNINDMPSDFPLARGLSYKNPIYVQNKEGLKNMYKDISISSLDYLHITPGLPFKVFEENRRGQLIASGGHKSKLFDLIATGYEDEILLNEASKFDFFIVEPLGFCPYLEDNHQVKDLDHYKSILEKIVELGKKLDKIVIAAGDVYYLDSPDYVYKNILTNYPRKRRLEKAGYFYLRTTDEMLEDFSFLGSEKARELVVDNPEKIDQMIEDISPIADGTFPPIMEDSDRILREGAYEKAISIYGDPLPEIVKARLDRELDSIISNGYATLYIIAKELVKKSNDDGYLVGSRGSVGSSFAATMADITEVNPLEPHYVCPSCKHSEFVGDSQYGTGVDLPEKLCPKCNTPYKRDGFDIPFEVFLGFEGDKEPDIDLNFAGVYQSSIHKYTETMFGERKVFRAGTLGTIAEKTAFGMAKKFKEFYPDDMTIRMDSANINKIKRKLVGIKRTTGQHAGGLIIVPEDKDIEDFTPIQYPADQKTSGVITTHFDYHAIDSNLLKLDLLGHNAPSIIRMLSDFTDLNALNIDLSDPDSMSIFNNTDKLNIKHDYTNIDQGSLGIPEFGTHFVRQMLKDTSPTTFEELVRISGLSHGTDVWLGNAQELINSGTTVLKNAICTRDDIMNFLISQGMDKKLSFTIMERVRKGKGLTDDQIEAMNESNIPQWYIDSCQKIKYMFPRAHAVAYVMMSFRIAYYKVHYPEYFYAVYFSNKIADFQYSIISKDLDFISMYIKEYRASNEAIDDKFYCIEVAEEMKAREIELLKPDLYKSDPENFLVVEKGKILAPLMAIDGVSQQIALRIAECRKDGDFLSIEDFRKRSKINKTALASMEAFDIFNGMQTENQLDFLSL